MWEVADIFRLHGADYRARFGDRLQPAQKQAMHDIEACRTAYFGGHIKQCDHCGKKVYAYHSCRNRSCPKCHGQQTQRWICRQQARRLPCLHYLLTFTLPNALRPVAQAHQKIVYGLLMRCAAAALIKLARDPRYVGGRIGCLAVLHTWTRALLYHPHVHLLVTAGGLSSDGQQWIDAKNPAFLVPVQALSVIFRAKMCAALKKAGLLDELPSKVWKTNWVVHCQPAGRGDKVLQYLGRYVFRIAITNSRLESLDNGQVTFRYRDNHTQQMRRVTLSALDFINRFLQHVLPQGCTKVRYYGIWSSSCRKQLLQARTLLRAEPAVAAPLPLVAASSNPSPETLLSPHLCSHCGTGHLIILEILPPHRKVPP